MFILKTTQIRCSLDIGHVCMRCLIEKQNEPWIMHTYLLYLYHLGGFYIPGLPILPE